MTKKKTTEEQLDEAQAEIRSLREQISALKGEGNWLNRITKYFKTEREDSRRREYFLSYMSYQIYDLPNRKKSIFCDTLKGFEEFSKLKGYVILLSVDTSLDNKVAFKFDFPDGSLKWSKHIIEKDLDEYLNRVTNNFGVDDLEVRCSKLQASQAKSTLRNRLLLIQHSYNSQRNVFDRVLKEKDAELQCSYGKIKKLENRLVSIEEENGVSNEEKALLEMELQEKKLECEMLRNASFDKDNVIEHLKDTIIKSLSSNKNMVHVSGGLTMSEKTNVIHATRSNVMIGSRNSSQEVTINNEISELLTRILNESQANNDVTKAELIEIHAAIDGIRQQVESDMPDQANIERNLNTLGSIASISSLVGQLVPLVLGML